jgi:hypothetical protein
MKNKITIIGFGLLGFIMLLNGCALFTPPPWINSNTTIVKNEKGEIIRSEYTRTIKGFSSNDPETAKSWVDADKTARIKNFGNFTNNRLATVRIKNNSSYPFEVTSGQFKGLVLRKGKISPYNRIIPIGLYNFKVQFVDNKGKLREWTVSRIILPSTKYITLKNGTR